MMTWDELVQQWWVQATSGLAVGLALMGIAAFFSKTVRDKFWKPIGRAIRWPFATIRFTTAKRQKALADELQSARASLAANSEFYAQLSDALGVVMLSGDQQLIGRVRQLRDDAEKNARRFKEVCDLLEVWPVREDSTVVVERITRLRDAKDAAWAHAKEQIEAAQSLAEKQLADQARRGGELAETARELGRAEGHAKAMAEVEAERAVPLLKPAWRIDPLGTADAFILKNTQHSVDISHVSVDAPTGEFQFAGATQMRGAFDRTFEFYGQKTESGRRLGVDFVVKWQDAHGEWWTQVVKVEREPRRMTVL
ncbi:hypothetical protein DOE76_01065 [Leifsonia sp. ku-ls]|nr:hypothetical protein DOE76_01065 [Leifsonia sp. ku-ls]